MAAGVKAAAFGAIVRILGSAFASPVLVFDVTGWANVLAAGAAITMTVGNLAAVRQENVKRHARVLVDRARRAT
jgi:NADH:ubiquinone oxidoreductase subunit 2 (subunit N)